MLIVAPYCGMAVWHYSRTILLSRCWRERWSRFPHWRCCNVHQLVEGRDVIVVLLLISTTPDRWSIRGNHNPILGMMMIYSIIVEVHDWDHVGAWKRILVHQWVRYDLLRADTMNHTDIHEVRQIENGFQVLFLVTIFVGHRLDKVGHPWIHPQLAG